MTYAVLRVICRKWMRRKCAKDNRVTSEFATVIKCSKCKEYEKNEDKAEEMHDYVGTDTVIFIYRLH